MIFLLFRIGVDRYAIEAARVAEVLPCVELKAIPQVLPGIAGVFDYHGQPVPVVDLNAVALGKPAKASMSTRLLVVYYPDPFNGDSKRRLLGVMAEMATEIARFNADDFKDPGTSAAGASFLGPVVTDSHGIIQRVKIEQLLSPEVRAALWRNEEVVTR